MVLLKGHRKVIDSLLYRPIEADKITWEKPYESLNLKI